MFSFCVSRLRCSEAEAYRRLHAARVSAQFPEILTLLRDGTLSLSAVSLLAPHRRREDFPELLSRAQGLTQNKLELLLAEIAPERAKRDCIRYLGHAPLPVLPPKEELFAGLPDRVPEPGEDAPGWEAGGARTPQEPLQTSPEGTAPHHGCDAPAQPAPAHPPPKPLVRFSFTADEGLLTEVERARALLRHKYPFARLEDIFREALSEFLEHRDPGRRIARKKRRRKGSPEPAGDGPPPAADRSRRIPRRVQDKVWERDQGRCAFVTPEGRRCEATGMLEFDHIVPWALGGLSDDPDNVRLLCRTHNQWLARVTFGKEGPPPP